MADPTPHTTIDWRGLGCIVAVIAIAGVVAAACGFATGTLAYRVLDANARPGDSWAEFGAAMLGLAFGLAAAAATFLVALAVGVRRVVAPGRRLRTTATILGCVVVGSASGQIGSATGPEAVRLLVMAVTLVASAALVGAAAGAVAPRPALAIAGLSLAVVICTGVVAAVRAPMLEDAAGTERYERSGAPLALFGGTSVAPPVDGWTVDHVDQGWSPDEVTITFDDGSMGHPTWVELHLTRAPHTRSCEQSTAPAPCIRLGERADGTVIWAEPSRYGRTAGGGSLVEAAWVDVAGGRWLLDGPSSPQPIDAEAAIAVLASLEPTDAAAFTAAT